MNEVQPAIDLTRHAFVREWKDLCIIGTWLFNNDQEDYEPALVVLPRHRRYGFRPVVVALSAAFKYNSPQYLAHAARKFNADLGFEDSMSNANKVAEAIHSHLGDLVTMPNNPTQKFVVGEASFDLGGGQKRTIELLDYVPLAQL